MCRQTVSFLNGVLTLNLLFVSHLGIGGGWTRAQIFKIMTDSRVGTYGCAALGLYTVTKVQLLTALGPSQWNVTVSAFPLSQGGGPAIMVSHAVACVTPPYLIRLFDYEDDEQSTMPMLFHTHWG